MTNSFMKKGGIRLLKMPIPAGIKMLWEVVFQVVLMHLLNYFPSTLRRFFMENINK